MTVKTRVSVGDGASMVYRPLVAVSVPRLAPFTLTRTAGSWLPSTAEVTVPVTRSGPACPQTSPVDTRRRNVAARLVANSEPPSRGDGRGRRMDLSPRVCSFDRYHTPRRLCQDNTVSTSGTTIA